MIRLLHKMVKPPNILIKTDLKEVFQSRRKLLDITLQEETYTIYQLLDKNVCCQPWLESCALILIEGNIHSTHLDVMKKYLDDCDGRLIVNKVDYETLKGSSLFTSYETEGDITWCKNSTGKFIAAILNNDITESNLQNILQHLSIQTKVTSKPIDICEVGNMFSMDDNFCLDNIFCQTEKYYSHEILNGDGLKIVFMKERDEDYFSYSGNVMKFCYDTTDCAFDWKTYRECLNTKSLGHYLMYTDLITSTQEVFTKINVSQMKTNGLVVTARQQCKGKGRSGNEWLSPIGCMMFSTQIDIQQNSNLGIRLPFIQHIAVVAFVRSVKKRKGYENLQLNLKWPNDIYINSSTKIGGVIVNSSLWKNNFKVTIGLGVNISNKKPTDCLNSIIEKYNADTRANLLPLSVEDTMATTLNEIEYLIDIFQSENGLEKFKEEYYRYWLHDGQTVQVESCDNKQGRIIGLDEYGFLVVSFGDDTCVSLQPDGNTFDMMKNLIKIK